MRSLHRKSLFRASATLRYRGKTFEYAGKGSVPCSASYLSQSDGSPPTLYYADLLKLGGKLGTLDPHNYRLVHIQVSWMRLRADDNQKTDCVFVVAPLIENGSDDLEGRSVLSRARGVEVIHAAGGAGGNFRFGPTTHGPAPEGNHEKLEV